MKTAVILSALLVTSNMAVADIYSSAIRQANNVANGQPREGAPQAPPAQVTPPPAAPPAAAQPDPVLEATMRNVASLKTDFAALANLANTNAVTTQRQELLDDLNEAAQANKPAPADVTKLAADLVAATVGRDKIQPQLQKLAQSIHAIFNSSHLTPAQEQMLFDSVEKILHDNGASFDDIQRVINDIKAIAAETK